MANYRTLMGYQYNDGSNEIKQGRLTAKDEKEAREKLKKRAQLAEKTGSCKFAIPVDVKKE